MPRPKNGKQIRVSTTDREKIQALYLEGLSFEEIAQVIPCRKSTFFHRRWQPYQKEDFEAVQLMSVLNARGKEAQKALYKPRGKSALRAGEELELLSRGGSSL